MARLPIGFFVPATVAEEIQAGESEGYGGIELAWATIATPSSPAAVGLRVTGSLGMLVRLKQASLIDKLAPVIATIEEAGIWYAPEVVRRVLAGVGEAQSSG